MTDAQRTASPAELQASWREGARLLREGRPAEALPFFRRIIDAGDANAAVWIATAMAHKGVSDGPAERAALEKALALDARSQRALIMMGDNYTAAGEARAASAYFDAALKLAAMRGPEPGLEADLRRAQEMREQYTRTYEGHLRAALGELDGPQTRRMRRALDLLLGKSELHLQQPKGFYFPELPNIEWAERADFPWMDRVEAATDDIRAELRRILEEDEGAFSPYVQASPDRPVFDNLGLLGNPSWSAFYLWKDGAPVPENAARCPATLAALEEAPLCKIPGRTPSILFSLLRPGAHIPPHHGFTNARYICHLPLIVPENCAMRVGSETRPWVEGKACIFDDSIEHEAWNRNPERLRVVLIFDVWRPELSEAERELVSRLLQAVDAYGGALPMGD